MIRVDVDSREREKTDLARGSNIGVHRWCHGDAHCTDVFRRFLLTAKGTTRLVCFRISRRQFPLSAVVVGLGTKEKNSELRKNKEKTTFRGVLKVLTRNDQLMWLSLTYALYTAGMQITNALELYYFTYILGDASQFSILASINAIIGVFAVIAFPDGCSQPASVFISIAVMIIVW